jgi:hypothetical protein
MTPVRPGRGALIISRRLHILSAHGVAAGAYLEIGGTLKNAELLRRTVRNGLEGTAIRREAGIGWLGLHLVRGAKTKGRKAYG